MSNKTNTKLMNVTRISRRKFIAATGMAGMAASMTPGSVFAKRLLSEPLYAEGNSAVADNLRPFDHTGIRQAESNNHKLLFDSEAGHYYEAAPTGNGRIGAMMFGHAVRERIVLNESGMWSGGVQDADRQEAYKSLPDIRRFLLEGRFKEATALFYKNFNCRGPGSGGAVGSELAFGCYQTLGDLNLYFHQAISGIGQCEGVSGYIRELDFRTGVSRVAYTVGGKHFTRECIAGRPHECIALRLQCNKPASISFNAQLSRSERFSVKAAGNDGLSMCGQLTNGKDGKGVKYACLIRVKTKGGEVAVDSNTLYVRRADEAVLYITMATDIKTSIGGRHIPDALKAAEQDMKATYVLSWETLHEDSVRAHSELYERSVLELKSSEIQATTPQRLRRLDRGEGDKGLYALLYHYSRYLLISSNRPGGLPANLQGIWGDEIQTPWNGDWHLNAQQMNFWAAETTNLSEMHKPYLELIYSLMEPGAKTAKAYYNARGWVVHTITNPWGFTSPGEGAQWGATSTCSIWLCQHVWDHFLFTNDMEYLRRFYPVLKGCALFYADMLVPDPKTGYLVTAPSNSPENSFKTESGSWALCTGPTYDNQLLRYLFSATIEAGRLVGDDSAFASMLEKMRSKLAPTRISQRTGGIQEWNEDYEEDRPYHRHTSHLWGVYPGDEITPEDTPLLALAAKRSLTKRGITSPGWANIHRVAILARIADGDAAENILRFHLRYSTYPNLFCRTYHNSESVRLTQMPEAGNYYYPFQIDANLGAGGSIAEMLLQSHRYTGDFRERVHEIHLLPALPSGWDAGSITGLCARGGFTVDLQWKDNSPVRIVIRSIWGRCADVSFMGHKVRLNFKQGESLILNSRLEPVES
jgi:alpha-L-fucosidase 2